MAKQCARCHGEGSIPCKLCGGSGDRFPFDPADLPGKECNECDGRVSLPAQSVTEAAKSTERTISRSNTPAGGQQINITRN